MAGMALSGGSLLSVLQGKRVYQPIWQIVAVQKSSGSNCNQLLVSDGKYVSYNVALHPTCHITFEKSQWKNQNSGKPAEDVLSSYRYPYIKVTDCIVKSGDSTNVVFLSKVKMLGWEKMKTPDILGRKEVDVVLGNCEIVSRSREGLEDFEDVPGIEVNECGDSEVVKYSSAADRKPRTLMEAFTQAAEKSKIVTKKLSEKDLLEGDLAPLGPLGLNILTLCTKCGSIKHAEDNKISQFKTPVKAIIDNLTDILPATKMKYEVCSCHDENDQFRKEFQNKCMVVNQDTSTGSDRKVQCILVSKDQQAAEEEEAATKLKMLTQETSEESNEDGIKCLVPISKKVARVSHKLKLCERCGVEERDMSACKHCAKVWYCSAACKKADLKTHTSVCRAYITARRFKEERLEFARQLQEPEDGCATCGFWRESLEKCNKCEKVSYCSNRCKDKSAEKHKPVCEAFTVIQNYRKKYILARSQEVD